MDILSSDHGLIDAAFLAVVLSAIPLGASVLVSLVVSVLQAATQVQEQTLTFVPKLATVCLVLFFCGSWMSAELTDYLSSVLLNLPRLQHLP